MIMKLVAPVQLHSIPILFGKITYGNIRDLKETTLFLHKDELHRASMQFWLKKYYVWTIGGILDPA